MLIFWMFVILVALICLNVPIAIALGVSALFGLVVTEGTDSIVTMALDMYDGSTKFSLIAIPMFVLAGAIMNASGISRRPDRLCRSTHRLRSRRTFHGHHRRVAVLRRNIGECRRRCGGHRFDPDPGDEEARLRRSVCGGGHFVLSLSGHHHSTVDPDDPLCGLGQYLGGTALRGRLRAGTDRCGRTDERRLFLRPQIRFPRRRHIQCRHAEGDLPRCAADLLAAGHHPGRHFRRVRDGDGGRGPCGARLYRDRVLLQRGQPAPPESGHARRRHADGGRHAAGRGLRPDGRLPDPRPDPAADCRRDPGPLPATNMRSF